MWGLISQHGIYFITGTQTAAQRPKKTPKTVSYLTLRWIITMASSSWTECAVPVTGTSVHMAPDLNMEKIPSGRTEAGSEAERAEYSEQHPRGSGPLPFFYQRCFVRGPWPSNLQQLIEVTDRVEAKETVPLEESKQQRDKPACLSDSSPGTDGLFVPEDLHNLLQKEKMENSSPAKAQLRSCFQNLLQLSSRLISRSYLHQSLHC